MMDRWAGSALVLLAFGAIVLGLLQVGGPQQARAETRDQQRLDDLRHYADYLSCTTGHARTKALDCAPMPMASDRFTKVPFQVTRDHVCAEFETKMALNHIEKISETDPKSGCILFRSR